jgi:hypothetical protein
MGLLAHKDTYCTSEDQVFSIAAPEWTPTWHPVEHKSVIHALQEAVNQIGLDISRKSYSLNKLGTKMFGVWQLQLSNDPTITPVLGFRNSIDKSLALGLCYGTHVFVCDNMAFSGDFVEFKRHTKSLTPEYLLHKFSEILPGVLQKADQFMNWHVNLKQFEVSYSDFRLLTFSAMDYDILPPSKFFPFIEAYKEENELTLFGFHGAVTRILRGKSFDIISSRTDRLNDMINSYLKSRGLLGNHTDIFADEHQAGYFDPIDVTYMDGSVYR